MSAGAVTVIVPVWNRRDLLDRLMDSLQAQTHTPEEVLVVDNGSTDGAPKLAAERGARVLAMGRNAGFSRAVNRGVEACRTEWLAIVNNDVVLDRRWLELLLDGALAARAWFATGKILSAADPRRIDGIDDALCRGGCAWRVGHGQADGPEFARSREVAMVSATAALFRTELFRRLGGLDESFDSFLEDVDFGLRCAAAGHLGRYVADAIAYHQGSATLGRWHAGTVERIARNQVLLIAKHYPSRLRLRWAWPIFVGQGLWGLVALRHGAGAAWLKGKIAGLRLLRSTNGPSDSAATAVIAASERRILDVQRRTCFDPYWRLYFRLTRGAWG